MESNTMEPNTTESNQQNQNETILAKYTQVDLPGFVAPNIVFHQANSQTKSKRFHLMRLVWSTTASSTGPIRKAHATSAANIVCRTASRSSTCSSKHP